MLFNDGLTMTEEPVILLVEPEIVIFCEPLRNLCNWRSLCSYEIVNFEVVWVAFPSIIGFSDLIGMILD